MTRRFDPELSLRLAGERALLDDRDGARTWWDDPVFEVASAFANVGIMPAERAAGIVADYQAALELRGRRSRSFHQAPPPAAAPIPAPVRVVACDTVVEQPWGEIRILFVTLDSSLTHLEVRVRQTSGSPAPPTGPHHQVLQQLQITDDAGTVGPLGYSGTIGEGTSRGSLESHTPMRIDTEWLAIGGVRFDLDRVHRPPPEGWSEALPDATPAQRHLRHRLAAAGVGHVHGPPPQLDSAIDALVEAGVLAPDDPLLAEIDAVVTGRGGHPRSGRPARGQHAGGQHGGGHGAMGPEWASYLARQHVTSDLAGVVAIGSMLPEVDGVAVRLDAVVATHHGFDAFVVTSPGLPHRGFRSEVAEPTIAWWARDDRGNWYHGATTSWSSGDGRSRGTVAFTPGLDPRARTLQVMPSGPTQRSVVALTDLPWSPRPVAHGG